MRERQFKHTARNLINKNKKRYGQYFSFTFLFSEAFLDLNKSSIHFLFALLYQVIRYRDKRSKKFESLNGKSVFFTEKSFRFYFGYSKKTYRNAKSELIKNGIIQVTHEGGKCQGDATLFEVLIFKEMPRHHQRWRGYPNKNWAHEIPKYPKNLRGKNTRIHKGTTPEKVKTIPTVVTPNIPTTVYPKLHLGYTTLPPKIDHKIAVNPFILATYVNLNDFNKKYSLGVPLVGHIRIHNHPEG